MEQIEPPSKILVIDDNAENRALASATLSDENYVVITAENGVDGIRVFETERPDCVLLDIRMPGLDGFEVCTRLRRLPGGADTPVVFLTALRDVEAFDRALVAGGDDFLTKPIRPGELVVRVQAALKLRRMNTELREYAELVRSQRNDLLRLQLQKERLTAFLVHDLKSPINALDLHAQVLLRTSGLPASALESVHHIRDEARALLRRVLNLLDISRSESGKLAPRSTLIDMEALTSEIFSELGLAVQASKVSLARRLQVRELRADPDLLRRVLENLLENAISHAPEASEVELGTQKVGEEIEIYVKDSGSGIPAAVRERIFDPFVRLEGGERQPPRTGRGLGLAFCKLAVEAHGGRVRVESAEPGAIFYIRIPI